MKKARSKKSLLALLALCVAALLLAACGGGTPPAATTSTGGAPSSQAASQPADSGNGESITLRVCWWGNQVRNDNTVNALNAYTEQNPNVTFEPEFSDWSGYWDKLAAQAASSSMPDVIQMDYAYLAQYAAKNQIIDLSPFIDSGALDIANVVEGCLTPANLDGKQVGISGGITIACMQYVKDVVEEAQVEIPDEMTWDQYMDICAQVYEATDTKSFIPGERQALEIMSKYMGLNLFDNDEHKIAIPDALVEQYFQMVYDASKQPWHIAPEVFVEKPVGSIETSPIIDGTTWCAFIRTNQTPTLALTVGKDLGLTNTPKPADATTFGVTIGNSCFWTIAGNSKYPNQAAAVINYFTNSETALDSLSIERGIPPSSAMAEYVMPTLSETEQEVIAYANSISAKATATSSITPAGSSEFDKLFDELIEMLRYDEITPADAATRLVAEGNEILERAAQ